MPTQTENMQEQGFRSSLFGFDKNDVLAYMNALANETRQQEHEYREQLSTLQEQLEQLQNENEQARRYAEQLQQELQQAEQRARAAEDKCVKLEAQNRQLDDRYKLARKTITELRFKCRELEAELEARKEAAPEMPPEQPLPFAPMSPEPSQPSMQPIQPPRTMPDMTPPVLEEARLTPPQEPATQPDQPDIAEAKELLDRARLEARKILTDARLYAENAEKQMQKRLEDQKNRMAEHASDLAAGVWLLRDRLSRVDERINAAAVEMENSTAAIYRALDDVSGDLSALGAQLKSYDPEDPVPTGVPNMGVAPEAVFDPTPTRQRVTARPVRQTTRSTGRLRRSARGSRPVSKDLTEAIEHFEG